MRLLALLNDSPRLAHLTAPIVCHPRVQTWIVGAPPCEDGHVQFISSDGPWTWCVDCDHRVA